MDDQFPGSDSDVAIEAPREETPRPRAPHDKVITLCALQARPDGTKPVYRLHKERLVLGSVVSADVRLVGEGIAPLHAVLELVQGGTPSEGVAVVYDLASDTGVFVNGQRVVTHAVRAGDKLRIGSQELQFNVDDLEQIALKERTRESEGRKLFLDPDEDFSPLLLEDERYVTQIFDYRPARKRALEVVMSWQGTILNVEHFVKERTVTIGSARKSHFGIPPILGQGSYAFVDRSGEEFTLNVEPKMRGVIQRKGRLCSLDELRMGTGTARIPLADDDFAKVTVGEVDFYLSYTAAPPRLKMSRILERDPLFMKVLFASAALSVAVIGALISTYQPQPVDVEQIPPRLATILYSPERYVDRDRELYQRSEEKTEERERQPKKRAEPPKPQPHPTQTVKLAITPHHHEPRPVPKTMDMSQHETRRAPTKAVKTGSRDARHQSEAREGEGAKAKGVSGSRGSRKAKSLSNHAHQTAARRPSPNGGKGSGGAHSQVADNGNVDILKDATGKLENILGGAERELGKGGEKLKGFGGFTTEGEGGLALSGKGLGGGGSADTTLGGLGRRGRGGGLVGTGRGAAGTGSGIIGGKARVAIRSGGPEEAVVMGSIDADAVEAALLAHKDEFRLCYEKEINAENPNLAGRVGTTFLIGSTGWVTRAGIESTTLHNANAERCILNVIKRIQFPIPRGAGVVQVTYPFKFNPVGNR